MANVLSRLKKPSESQPTPSSEHDLERALERAGDARDIGKDFLRRLPDYTGSEEESTARHEIPQQVHVHVHQDSIHDRDSEPPAKKLKGAAVAVGMGLGTALLAGVAAIIQQCGHH